MSKHSFRAILRRQLDDLGQQLARRQQVDALAAEGWDSSAEARAQRLAAIRDPDDGFFAFVQTYFPHYLRHPSQSQLHRYLFRRLPEILRAPLSTLNAIAAPRGEAKSTLVARLFTLYCAVLAKKRFVVLIMESINQAYPTLAAIKDELENNERLRADFPEVCGPGRQWQAGRIITRNGIKIEVAGTGKKLRGLHHGPHRPDLTILDDLENDENVRSPGQRDKLHDWLLKTVMPLGAAGDKYDIVYIGTILHYDSVLARTLKSQQWQPQRFRAILQMPDNMALWDEWEALYRNEGSAASDAFYSAHEAAMTAGAEVSWAARPLKYLMEIRARDGHSTFASEYQNDPVAGDEAPFAGALQFALPPAGAELLYYGALDPSLGLAGKSRDPSAIIIGALERATGRLFVVEALIAKRRPEKIIEDVIELQRQYQCQRWFIESVQFQEFLRQEIIRRSREQGVPVPAVAVKPHRDKLLRIESLQPHMASGSILLQPSQNTLIDQLRHYPKADHDDGPDALHMLWEGIMGKRNQSEITPVDIGPVQW